MLIGDTALDVFEPGTHVFTGTVVECDRERAELWTDSGFAVHLITQGQAPVRKGARVTVVTRKYRPSYHVVGLRRH